MSAGDGTNDWKLIIKGLPFETTLDDLCEFLDLPPEKVKMVTWHDNKERCKGHAYIGNINQAEVNEIKQNSGREFDASGNTRSIKIEDYEDKQKSRKSRSTRREKADKASFEHDEDSRREVYVSNLAFDAKEENFNTVFGEHGEIESITIPKIYSSGRPKGFAFVRFKTVEQKEAAIQALDGTTFVGRVIGVRENQGRASGGNKFRKNETRKRQNLDGPIEGCTTIYVGNLPWSTDEPELQDLFAQFGEIKNTRVVRKSWTPTKSRGFGYVEFVDAEGMEKAIKEGTESELECQGRKLRLDYAEPIKNQNTN